MRLYGDLMQQPTDWQTAEEWYLDVQGKAEKDRRQVSIMAGVYVHNRAHGVHNALCVA